MFNKSNVRRLTGVIYKSPPQVGGVLIPHHMAPAEL